MGKTAYAIKIDHASPLSQGFSPAENYSVTLLTTADLVTEDGSGQMSLFADAHDGRREKTEKIERAMDNIRGRFGKSAISSGATVKNDMGIRLET
jgi:hypothetical protein